MQTGTLNGSREMENGHKYQLTLYMKYFESWTCSNLPNLPTMCPAKIREGVLVSLTGQEEAEGIITTVGGRQVHGPRGRVRSLGVPIRGVGALPQLQNPSIDPFWKRPRRPKRETFCGVYFFSLLL